MNTTSSSYKRALVLGGGGSTGNAWLIGVLAGLYEAGLDVTTADLTIGTSAGSTAAAQVVAATPSELFAAILDTPVPGGRAPTRPVTDHLDRMKALIASADDAADLRRTVGAAALERAAATDESWQAQWRTTVASRFPGASWPDRTVLITAMDARTGDGVVFDRLSGVDLVDAVAASCSSGLPYTINGTPYLDGGFRSNAENADLAAGCDRVLVLAPFGGATLTPEEWGTHLATQIDELCARGSKVEAIFPDADSEHLFGANAMDGSLRPAAARVGFDQAAGLAERVGDFWR